MREGFPSSAEVDDARFKFEVAQSNLVSARHGREHSKSVYKIWESLDVKLSEALFARAEKKFAALKERQEAGEFLESYDLRGKYEQLKTNVERAVQELESFEVSELKIEDEEGVAQKES